MDQDQPQSPAPPPADLTDLTDLTRLPTTVLWNELSERLGPEMQRMEEMEADLAEAFQIADRLLLASSEVCFCKDCRTTVLSAFDGDQQCPNCYPGGHFQCLKEPHGRLVCALCLGDENPLVRRMTEIRGLLYPYLGADVGPAFTDGVLVPEPGESPSSRALVAVEEEEE